jgi:cyclophilin family peptidyl-prolyl cis-trans isomerase
MKAVHETHGFLETPGDSFGDSGRFGRDGGGSAGGHQDQRRHHPAGTLPSKAPKTVANFLQYVKDGFFNGTIFHRVISDFMIQTGGLDKNMREKKGRDPIPNEAKNGLKNELGTIAMARTSDPHSASSQFFINLKYNDFLDSANAQDGWGYAVFGKVVSGMDVVTKISKVPTGNSGMFSDVPRETIVIESATLVSGK